jgi:hypothetical protein
MNDTRESHRSTIFSIAKESLAEHILKQDADVSDFRVWTCKNPKSSFYWYRVIAVPGCLIIQGDVGNRIFTMYDRDPVGWLRGAINSPDYVMGKCEDKGKDFLVGEAKALLQNLRDGQETEDEHGVVDNYVVEENNNLKAKVEEVEEAWTDEHDADQFSRAYYEAGLDTEDLSCCYDFNSDIIWSYACLKKFIEILDTQATKV